MSYVALVTDRFDEVVAFYGESLHFPVVNRWERSNARGLRFDLGGMRLEILDNSRERQPLTLGEPADRVHVVIEVDDIEAVRAALLAAGYEATEKKLGSDHSWQAWTRDPSGIRIEFHQYTAKSSQLTHEDCILS